MAICIKYVFCQLRILQSFLQNRHWQENGAEHKIRMRYGFPRAVIQPAAGLDVPLLMGKESVRQEEYQ